VGIFSLFGKKDNPTVPSPAEKPAPRKKSEDEPARANTDPDGSRASGQRSAAKATALKIDAIESEMSSEFVKPRQGARPPANKAPSSARPAAAPSPPKPASPKPSAAHAPPPTTSAPNTLSAGSEFLLHANTTTAAVAISAPEITPAIEEAAILFANNQMDMVEQILQSAISEDTSGQAGMTAWRMLFDLYEITGKQAEFEHLSIVYAGKFETSPPSWTSAAVDPNKSSAPAGATPTVPFSGKLDGKIIKQLERVQNLAENNRVIRLEFQRITEVDPIGCGILLSVMKKLQKSDNDLILVGAAELVAKIRAILEVGRRTETEAPWLLMLEMLRLLNLEKDFEESSIDYCVTFEVSPPPFVAPKNKVTTAADEPSTDKSATEHFMMPATVEGRTDQLIASIVAYADEHKHAVLDCSALIRLDFSAAGQLMAGLAPLLGKGVTLELHNVNHLVTALMYIMGMQDIFLIKPRKN
jgi:anti-anti-sigma regulatory factor